MPEGQDQQKAGADGIVRLRLSDRDSAGPDCLVPVRHADGTANAQTKNGLDEAQTGAQRRAIKKIEGASTI